MSPSAGSELSFLSDPQGPMAAVINASHNGIMILDRQGVIVCFNTSASRIFNEKPDTIVGQHFSSFRPEAWPDLQRILETGQPQDYPVKT